MASKVNYDPIGFCNIVHKRLTRRRGSPRRTGRSTSSRRCRRCRPRFLVRIKKSNFSFECCNHFSYIPNYIDVRLTHDATRPFALPGFEPSSVELHWFGDLLRGTLPAELPGHGALTRLNGFNHHLAWFPEVQPTRECLDLFFVFTYHSEQDIFELVMVVVHVPKLESNYL